MKHYAKFKWVVIDMVTVAVLLKAFSCESMVYMWKDTSGTRHYTNCEYEIPGRYREKAKRLYPETGDSGQSRSSENRTGQTNPVVQVSPPATPQLSHDGQQLEHVERSVSRSRRVRELSPERRRSRNQVRRVEEEE